MIYVDTSVALAAIFAEPRRPPDDFWDADLVSSRLVQYEIVVTLNTRGFAATHANAATSVLSKIALLELSPRVLERALSPLPSPRRTLDALHLASIEFLRANSQAPLLASYDQRMLQAASALRIPTHPLPGS